MRVENKFREKWEVLVVVWKEIWEKIKNVMNINCIHSNAVVIAERIGWQHFHLKKEFVKKLQICFTIYFEEVSGETPRCITIHHHYLCIIFSIDIDNGDDNLEGFRDCGQSSS